MDKGDTIMGRARIATACAAGLFALGGFTAATASAEVQDESATQAAVAPEYAEEAEEAADVAEEAAETAEEGGAATQFAVVAKKKHPGFEYQLRHLRKVLARLRARKAELKARPRTPVLDEWLLRQKQEMAKARKRRHEVRLKLKAVERKEKER